MKQSKFNVGDQVTVKGFTGHYTVSNITYDSNFDTHEYELKEVPNSVVIEGYLRQPYQYDDMGTYFVS